MRGGDGLVWAGLVTDVDRGVGAASDAGREAGGALGLVAGWVREGAAFAAFLGAAALRVATRFFFAALFFRPVARLGPAARLVARRLVLALWRAVARGLRRVVDFRRVLGRGAMIDLLAMVGRA
jgi:hypothetical protein